MARGQSIINKVFNKPQLITLDSLQPITDYLSNPERVAGLKLEKEEERVKLTLADFNNNNEDYRRYQLQDLGINPDTMVGQLDISGTLVNRSGQMNANCTELTSYEGLKKQAEAQINAGATSLVLKVDSGGGEAYGVFSAANHIKKIAKQNGVKTVAYVDGTSASAALGLSVLADEIVAHPQSRVGSVGVVVALYNDSKYLENLGVKRSFVFAGDNKIPFDNSTGEFTEKFLSDLQKSVDKTYKTFVEHIATNRGMSTQAVIDTQAAVFDADEALTVGFIDKVMELEDFEIQYGLKTSADNKATGFNQYLESPVEQIKLEKEDGMSKENDVVLTVEQLQEQLTSELAAKQTLADQLAKANEQLGELAGIKEQLNTLQEAHTKLLGEVAEKEHQSKLDARQAKLEAALGKDNEQVATLLASTESLEDAAFDVIAQSLSTSVEKKQEQLKEIGGEGQQSDTQLSLGELIAKKVTPRK